MKIAFVHFYTFRLLRGIETLIISLANVLVRKGIEVSIVTAKPTTQPLISPDPRVKIYAYPTFRYYEHLTIVPFYVSHFLRHEYDQVVVFFADYGEGTAWRIVNLIRNIPLTLYLCYPFSAVPHRYLSFLRLGWHQKASHLAVAPWIAKEAQDLFQRSVHVVPIGTDPQQFCPDSKSRESLRREWGFTSENIVLLSVSTLERRKGTWRAIQAMGRLQERFPHLRYFILGQGDDEPNLRKRVEDLHLNDRVIFGGTTSHLEGYYNMADIFVMLPDAEANSIACHEAMSCGLPVVVSNSGGFVETVPTQAGFLVNPDAPGEIDDRLVELIANPLLRQRMGRAGRANIIEHLTWDRIAEQFLEIANVRTLEKV